MKSVASGTNLFSFLVLKMERVSVIKASLLVILFCTPPPPRLVSSLQWKGKEEFDLFGSRFFNIKVAVIIIRACSNI